MAAVAAWQPQEAPLRTLIGYLNDTLSGNMNAQRRAEVVSIAEVIGGRR